MRDMETEEAAAILEASRMGILSLCESGKAYALPLFYGYDGEDLYFHCHPGLKDEYIGDTKEACFVVVHMESENVWESVHAFGPIEKLTLSDDLEAAKNALFQVPFPPAEGNFPHGTPVRTEQNVYYLRLKPTRFSGKASAFEAQA